MLPVLLYYAKWHRVIIPYVSVVVNMRYSVDDHSAMSNAIVSYIYIQNVCQEGWKWGVSGM